MEQTKLVVPEPTFRGSFLADSAFQRMNPIPVRILELKQIEIPTKNGIKEGIDVYFSVPLSDAEFKGKEFSQRVFRDSKQYKQLADAIMKGVMNFSLLKEEMPEGKSRRNFLLLE